MIKDKDNDEDHDNDNYNNDTGGRRLSKGWTRARAREGSRRSSFNRLWTGERWDLCASYIRSNIMTPISIIANRCVIVRKPVVKFESFRVKERFSESESFQEARRHV